MNVIARNLMMLLGLGVSAGIGGAVATTYMRSESFAQARREVGEAKASLAGVPDLADVFKRVNRAVEPAVVEIRTRSVVSRGRGGMIPMPFGGEEGQVLREGNGSGVILDVSDGGAFILTNNHVVDDATNLEVVLSDRRVISDVKVVGTDPQTDLAVVRIPADRVMSAGWGDSTKLEKGDWVVAFGSPFGYVGSMTTGIVSALNRNVGILGPTGFEDFIQTDAAINPGNSGGPLVNLRGEVIGINAAIASRTGAFSGLGFAIPSELARPIYERIRAEGRITRGWLGVSIIDVGDPEPRARELIAGTGFKGTAGVFVAETMREGPAFEHLRAGDIITEVGGTAVATSRDLRERISRTAPGSEVKLTVFRDGKVTSVGVKVGEQPGVNQMAARGGQRAPRPEEARPEVVLGMRLGTLDDALARQFGVQGVVESGAVVTAVEAGSLAARAGLRAGDVITRANGVPIASAAELARLASRGGGEAVNLRLSVVNRDGSRFVLIRGNP
jgi:serine protease Do